MRQLLERHAGAARSVDRQRRDLLLIVAYVLRVLQPYGHGPLPFPELRYHAAGQRRLDAACRVAHRHAGVRELEPVEPNAELRCRSITVQVEIGDAGDVLQRHLRFLERGAHLREILAEDLQNHLAAHAADRFLYVVLDRRREVETHARDLQEPRAHGLHEPFLVPAGGPLAFGFQVDVGLRHVHAFVVRAVLRTAVFAQHLKDLGEFEDPLANVDEHVLTLGHRDAGRHFHHDVEIALVELRQELRADAHHGPTTDAHQQEARDEYAQAVHQRTL